MGISFLVHALESEMLGQEWEIPAPLHEGLNVNMLQESLDRSLDETLATSKSDHSDAFVPYNGMTFATLWIAIMFLLWHLWQEWWHGAKSRVILLPQKAYSTLVDRTRKEAEAEGYCTDIRLSTGDIIVAWFFKVLNSRATYSLAYHLYRRFTLTEPCHQQLFSVQAWPQ